MRIGLQAMRIAIAGFVIPFMAVYDPALMLQGDSLLDTGYMVLKAALAIGLWGAGSIGYLWSPLGWPARIAAAGSAGLLVAALPLTDELGFGAAALFLGWQLWARRRAAAAATA
jgi:TRAP-type uncharacterized transport system fused permease subunit